MKTCRITLNEQLIFEADSLQDQLFSCVVNTSSTQSPKEADLGPIHLAASARILPNELPQDLNPEALRKHLSQHGIETRTSLKVGDRIVIEVG
ncbi:MAG: hypothetical protein AAF399_05930 [Bacteroidota bacterium]